MTHTPQATLSTATPLSEINGIQAFLPTDQRRLLHKDGSTSPHTSSGKPSQLHTTLSLPTPFFAAHPVFTVMLTQKVVKHGGMMPYTDPHLHTSVERETLHNAKVNAKHLTEDCSWDQDTYHLRTVHQRTPPKDLSLSSESGLDFSAVGAEGSGRPADTGAARAAQTQLPAENAPPQGGAAAPHRPRAPFPRAGGAASAPRPRPPRRSPAIRRRKRPPPGAVTAGAAAALGPGAPSPAELCHAGPGRARLRAGPAALGPRRTGEATRLPPATSRSGRRQLPYPHFHRLLPSRHRRGSGSRWSDGELGRRCSIGLWSRCRRWCCTLPSSSSASAGGSPDTGLSEPASIQPCHTPLSQCQCQMAATTAECCGPPARGSHPQYSSHCSICCLWREQTGFRSHILNELIKTIAVALEQNNHVLVQNHGLMAFLLFTCLQYHSNWKNPSRF
ncbi:uncharacterized protein LOC141954119 [Strix uralensis]|uniref:uncharacterized protein LOC141954119 n=1 Tax=Strix uralensis TaxID=36305 RepID=UPI003DA78E62